MHACIHVQTGVNFQAHANANVFFHVQELRQCKVISKKPVIPTLLSSWFIPRHIHVCVYMMSHTHICHQTKTEYTDLHTHERWLRFTTLLTDTATIARLY